MAAFLERNYGFAGRDFVERLQEGGNMDKMREIQNRLTDEISAFGDITDRQSASAALILTADRLAEEWIFHDGVRLQGEDIAPFLITKMRWSSCTTYRYNVPLCRPRRRKTICIISEEIYTH